MPSLLEVADDVCRGRGILLCLDTCAILDVIRAAVRDNLGATAVAAAQEVVAAAAVTPPRIVPVVSPFVPAEYHAGEPKAAQEARDKLRGWFKALANVTETLQLLEIPAGVMPPVDQIVKTLQGISSALYGSCRVLESDPHAANDALRRLQNGVRPCHEFRTSDALHLEHYLALTRCVRDIDQSRRCLFVSPNTSDFAELKGSTRLHPDLVTDFDTAGLEYFASLESAIRSLRQSDTDGYR